jgi:hypothetical protein
LDCEDEDEADASVLMDKAGAIGCCGDAAAASNGRCVEVGVFSALGSISVSSGLLVSLVVVVLVITVDIGWLSSFVIVSSSLLSESDLSK